MLKKFAYLYLKKLIQLKNGYIFLTKKAIYMYFLQIWLYISYLSMKNKMSCYEISNNVVCATSKASDQPALTQTDQSHCKSLDYSMSVKLLTEHHFEFLSLIGGCTGSSESIHVKMPHCSKSHVAAQLCCGAHWKHLNETLLVSQYPHYMFC